MKELLQRIAANSHKVPGLEVFFKPRDTGGWRFPVYYNEGYQESDALGPDYGLRSALMLIVDAIEAAGLARFSRESFLLSDGPAWEWNAHPNASKRVVTDKWFVSSENKQEHIALAECLAAVMEALPEVKNES
jgi:FAD/FMN-containing dehydrogenase